jgi:hypothetical protein
MYRRFFQSGGIAAVDRTESLDLDSCSQARCEQGGEQRICEGEAVVPCGTGGVPLGGQLEIRMNCGKRDGRI